MPVLTMDPEPGRTLVRYVGDRLRVALDWKDGEPPAAVLLRTNLGRAVRAREEVIDLAGTEASEGRTFAGSSWRDLPMRPAGPGRWELDLALTEVGWFRAKAFALDAQGRQHWPQGGDLGVAVHPDHLRSRNTIYCAFPRMFGPSRRLGSTANPLLEPRLKELEAQGYAVLPPSGRLRDLKAQVPHIMDTLGCRILHLLPLGPTPTTYARMGRFGSPYAILDLCAIDPALVDFDQRTTAVEQFQELADSVHLRGGLVFLDIVVNHTGWGARLQEEHPEWYQRNPDGTFHSPGAWGIVWGDLVELDQRHTGLWEEIAAALLTWCRRGVDGFRCDAGYMVPLPAWQYLVARVRREFPDTTFLLEGLGGAWEATEALLTEGGMQWAYSELFQNHDGGQVSGYLDHALRQVERLGPLVHYSETHDNARLAARGRAWSLLRNRLCALSSVCGAFGFTNGVEWLAAEQVDVHQARGLNWGAEPGLVPELARLNRLISDHPCWFDGARLERLSPPGSTVLALLRVSREGCDRVLALVNLDADRPANLSLSREAWGALGPLPFELLGQRPPQPAPSGDAVLFHLEPGASFVLGATREPRGLAGEAYRRARAQSAWALQQLARALPGCEPGPADWRALAERVDADPGAFLEALGRLDPAAQEKDLLGALEAAAMAGGYPALLRWSPAEARRITLVPPGHGVLLEDQRPFAATLEREGEAPLHLRSIPWRGGHMACLPPLEAPARARDGHLRLSRFEEAGQRTEALLRFLPAEPPALEPGLEGLALLTNGRGAMARLYADLGAVHSKYDCVLGANLHPEAPCDRHVLAKRLRVWADADGFITPLCRANLVSFQAGPPARWVFAANAGDGRVAEIHLSAELLPGRNTVVFRFHRPAGPPCRGAALPPERGVSLSLRMDLEDRSYHGETQAGPDAEAHFTAHTAALPEGAGFRFQPAADRHLEVRILGGRYHEGPEWSLDLPHDVEGGRGMRDRGDAWSPGWFQLPLAPGGGGTLAASAEEGFPATVEETAREGASALPHDFERVLRDALPAFLVKRGQGGSVIAGYPWFLDWGRDTLIAVRGLVAAGLRGEVPRLLATFGALEEGGTLPNMLGAEHTGNRETSDAPLWFALACQEAAEAWGPELLEVDCGGRTLKEVLRAIAAGHLAGVPNGVRVDPESALVWSPPHYTWMDTNHPAASPRQGYPIELQALWIRLLRFLAALELPPPAGPSASWQALADRAASSLERYWIPERGFLSDCLHAGPGVPAARAVADDHLRPNQLFTVSLGLVKGERARRVVEACGRHLLVPGALRSLAPLPVRHPLPVEKEGRLLNDPQNPYWGRYEGDEDTRRKPAYHNGTAWVWPLATYCEALWEAWERCPRAREAALAILGSTSALLEEGCIGQLPEILDGDAPHTQRGCDAQAWSVSETLRVWVKVGSEENRQMPKR